MLFSLKVVKIAKCWGLCPQTPLPPATGGFNLRPPHQSSYIVNSSLCICPQSTDSFRIDQKTLFSWNYSGSAPGFRRRKNYVAFRMPQTTEIITIGFNFFVLPPPPLILRWRRPWLRCLKNVTNETNQLYDCTLIASLSWTWKVRLKWCNKIFVSVLIFRL